MKPFAYAVTLAGSTKTWLILASYEGTLQPLSNAGIEMSIQPLYAQEPPPVQLSEEQARKANLLAKMVATSDRFGFLAPRCMREETWDVAQGFVDPYGIELTEAGKALKQRMVQMMHDARVKGGA